MHKLNKLLHSICKIRNVFSHLRQLASKSRANTANDTSNKCAKCLADFAHSRNGIVKILAKNIKLHQSAKSFKNGSNCGDRGNNAKTSGCNPNNAHISHNGHCSRKRQQYTGHGNSNGQYIFRIRQTCQLIQYKPYSRYSQRNHSYSCKRPAIDALSSGNSQGKHSHDTIQRNRRSSQAVSIHGRHNSHQCCQSGHRSGNCNNGLITAGSFAAQGHQDSEHYRNGSNNSYAFCKFAGWDFANYIHRTSKYSNSSAHSKDAYPCFYRVCSCILCHSNQHCKEHAHQSNGGNAFSQSRTVQIIDVTDNLHHDVQGSTDHQQRFTSLIRICSSFAYTSNNPFQCQHNSAKHTKAFQHGLQRHIAHCLDHL